MNKLQIRYKIFRNLSFSEYLFTNLACSMPQRSVSGKKQKRKVIASHQHKPSTVIDGLFIQELICNRVAELRSTLNFRCTVADFLSSNNFRCDVADFSILTSDFQSTVLDFEYTKKNCSFLI